GHLDALIVVGACRHPDMDCLNLGKVMLGVIMSYRHPLAQHQTVSLDDIKPYPVSISEDFDRFNDSVAEFYRERGIDILVSATTAAQFERYLTRENGLALTVGVPALGQFNPLTELKPMAAKDSVSVPICLVSLKGRKAPAYAGFERWMTNELAVKGGDPVRRFVSTTASTPACSEAGTGC
ncbi:LysR substrate-binding domain-containing protein, partial [Eggerthella lenta]|uniref:LysR substrate-binding domain-containing protein n=3 Tax=Eggerthellaceae TaxID=1643826 RepID=UPI001E56A56E